jgi:tetratricopeptide (TPR) repeat protein
LEALDAYARAAEVNPHDLSGMLGMAHMYRRLNRPSEAIALYEKAFNASNRTNDILARFLSLGYVAGGRDEKAVDVLLGMGLPETEVVTRMQELRERVKIERSQPER